MLEHGLSATDVGHALANQNIVLPAGDQKIGAIDYMVATNATPIAIDSFNNMPIKQVGNAVVYLRDVAYVHRGGPPQQNAVLVKGHQSILLQILKSGDASTLAVVSGVRAMLPQLLKTLPPGVTITPLNDASTFVRASIADVVQEMVTAACLAGIAVLLFVGSWRSTLIVATSIPLSILSSILVLSWLGQDINIMTLGGLALAVGILVDDATVMIENINTHLEEADAGGNHKGLEDAIIDAANQIVVPTFVSTLCICIVWLPLLQLGGVAGYLFLPLAEAIIFAMIASFILSRTLTPTMAAWLLPAQVAAMHKPPPEHPGFFTRFQAGFEARFTRFRNRYRAVLEAITARRKRFVLLYLGGALASLLLLLFVGQNFFPSIKSGEIDLHMRAPVGTRIEESGKIAVLVEQQIRDLLPGHVTGTLVNCGLPVMRHQPGVHQHRHDRQPGLRHHDLTRQPGVSGCSLPQYPARRPDGPLSRHRFQFPAGRHHGEDPELRTAFADRRAGQRPRSRRQLRLCQQADRTPEADRRHRRRPHPAGHGPADPAAVIAANLRPGDRPDRSGHRQQRPHRPVGQRPGGTDLLARHDERHLTPGQHPDATESAQQHERP